MRPAPLLPVLLLLLALACLSAPEAVAATLKPYTAISGAVVRLSDLWDGVVADKDLGPAPAPGGRITVPAAQLAAIARQFDVDWHPSSGNEQAVLERGGRSLMRDDVMPKLRDALVAAGVSTQAEVELGAFTAPLLPQGTSLDVAVAQVEVDRLSGRFSAQVDVTIPAAAPLQLRVSGRIQDMIDVPVARRRIMPGEVVAAADLDWAHVPRAFTRGEIVRVPADAVGQSARQTIQPAQPIPVADLGRPTLIRKGNEVVLTLDSPGLSLSARGIAMEPGGNGEHIRVLNEYTRMSVEAVVLGPGQARVIAGTAQPATRMAAVR